MKKIILTIFIALVTLSTGFAAGTISGHAGIGVTLSYYEGGVFKTVTTDGTLGNYSIVLTTSPWTGIVTPSMSGSSFAPIGRSYYDLTTASTGQDFTATGSGLTIQGNTHLSPSGAITGVTISYTDAVGGNTAQTVVDGSGNYLITVVSGWSGSVGASLAGYTFTPNNGYSFTANGSNQTGKDFVGATTSYAAQHTILNGAGNGSTYSFDIYSRSVGSSPITLSTTNYYFFYNTAALGTTVSAVLGPNYSYSLTPYSVSVSATSSPGEIAVTLNFGSGTGHTLSTASLNGEVVCTVTINVTNSAQTSNIQWDVINSASSDVTILHAIADTYTGIENDLLPVELSTFVTNTNGRNIQLNWETKTEKNSDRFLVQRMQIDGNSNSWLEIGSVKAAVLSNSPKYYSLIDQNLYPGRYQYRLKMVDNDGTFEYSKILQASVATPTQFDLGQNYPNPFNPTTKINYNLPFDSNVTLEVFNLAGERISQLVNENKPAGFYSADFSSSSINRNIPSGVYFYKITAVDNATGKNLSSIKKMMLLK
jgi:hypothetical protein